MRRILLDENIPVSRRLWFPEGCAESVGFRGWKGIQNGALLRRAVEAGFTVLVTADRRLPLEHDLPRSFPSLAIVILPTNARHLLLPLRGAIVAAAMEASPGGCVVIPPQG